MLHLLMLENNEKNEEFFLKMRINVIFADENSIRE